MNIFLEESELEEIKPFDPSEDKGIVINPRTGNGGESKPEISELRKEITAIDTIESTARRAAELNGVGKSNAALYAKGIGIEDPDSRARVLATRNNIQDVATAKLMDMLNLINPEGVEKERDKIAIATGLSQVIEKLNPGNKEVSDKPTVHLHLYSPTQKKENDYDVIDA